MATDYHSHEEACREIRRENDALLEEWVAWLRAKGLSDQTVAKHTENINFYVNHFLLYEDATRAAEGAHQVGTFLGYWFIRKAMWATKASIRSNATSLKKFYQFMYERGAICREELTDMRVRIKEDLPEWLATLERYDDPSIDDPFEMWE